MRTTDQQTTPNPAGIGLCLGEFDKYQDFYPPTSNRRPE